MLRQHHALHTTLGHAQHSICGRQVNRYSCCRPMPSPDRGPPSGWRAHWRCPGRLTGRTALAGWAQAAPQSAGTLPEALGVPSDPLQRRWCQALRRQHGRQIQTLAHETKLPTSLVPGSKPLILSMHFAKSSPDWSVCLLLVLAAFAVHNCGAVECRDPDGPLGMEGNAYTGKYSEELIATAKRLASAGKGILAADESTGTVGKRVRVSRAPCHALDRSSPCMSTPPPSPSPD